MKIALISDTHANIPALNAALEDIRVQGVDQIIFLGDAATLGPHPRETLDILRSLNCVCIMGNHDAAMLDPTQAADLEISTPLIPTLEWGISQLTQTDFDFLRTFQPNYELNLGNSLSMLCFHGSPRSSIDMLLPTTTKYILGKLNTHYSAKILAGGHTHIQMLCQHGEQVVLNAGSVGSAFLEPFFPGGPTPTLLPWAEYAILRVEKDVWDADFRRVRFDPQTLHHAVAASDAPNKELWLSQYR